MNSDEIKVLYKVGCKYNFFYTKKVEGVNKKKKGRKNFRPFLDCIGFTDYRLMCTL